MKGETCSRRRAALLAVTMAALLLAGPQVRAQRMSVYTNLPSYALLGTVSIGADFAVGQHSTIGAGVRFNPFDLKYKGREIYFHHAMPSINYTWWQWNYFSGFYVSAKAQYGMYNTKNIREFNAQGYLLGCGLSAGYGWMLTHHLNLTIGLGALAGSTWYTRYTDDSFTQTAEHSHKLFIIPDEPTLSLNIIF